MLNILTIDFHSDINFRSVSRNVNIPTFYTVNMVDVLLPTVTGIVSTFRLCVYVYVCLSVCGFMVKCSPGETYYSGKYHMILSQRITMSVQIISLFFLGLFVTSC